MAVTIAETSGHVTETELKSPLSPPVTMRRNDRSHSPKYAGRAIWKRYSGYHRYSLVPTKMNCFKRLGEKVMARTFERQVTELNIRAPILNQFTELGTPQTVAVA